MGELRDRARFILVEGLLLHRAEDQGDAGQLREMASELKLRELATPATYEQIHRALLTGLIGNVGMKALDGDHYHGPRGIQFHIWPGSGLKKGRPKWIMAGELQETTRVFARNVARVEVDWIEQAAAHLVERTYAELIHFVRSADEFRRIAGHTKREGLVVNREADGFLLVAIHGRNQPASESI